MKRIGQPSISTYAFATHYTYHGITTDAALTVQVDEAWKMSASPETASLTCNGLGASLRLLLRDRVFTSSPAAAIWREKTILNQAVEG
jgi:hypothetical protein